MAASFILRSSITTQMVTRSDSLCDSFSELPASSIDRVCSGPSHVASAMQKGTKWLLPIDGGSSLAFGGGFSAPWLCKRWTHNATVQWCRGYGGIELTVGLWSFSTASNGGFVLAARRAGVPSGTGSWIALVRLNSTGYAIWARQYQADTATGIESGARLLCSWFTCVTQWRQC